MKASECKRALACAVEAARAAGELMRKHLYRAKRVNETSRHDIKLELDVRAQKLICTTLAAQFPEVGMLGEEGDAGNIEAAARWVVDPIDGTVNYFYGIPHACVSIALQTKAPGAAAGHQTVVGVVYDPFVDEMWTAVRGSKARLNGRVIHVSRRKNIRDSIVSTGFAKDKKSLEANLPYFIRLARRARKIRITGAAALALSYVATGRFDAYVERGVRLWDIAAGGLIVECAGGEFWHEQVTADGVYRMIATNGLIGKQVPKLD